MLLLVPPKKMQVTVGVTRGEGGTVLQLTVRAGGGGRGTSVVRLVGACHQC
jgi:hypothetical protein